MSDLSFAERSHLEKLFQMGGGYVLDFSNRTFQEFVFDVVRKDILDPKYNNSTGSKANRLRQFWKLEQNHVVGVLTRQMVEYAKTVPNVEEDLVTEARRIADRLLSALPVPELDAITAICDDRTFEALA